jgi:hypothetical protein
MVARSNKTRVRPIQLLAAGCFSWAFMVAVPAYAYDYGAGNYGAGLYGTGLGESTSTVLVSDTNPSTVGDSVTLTATVTPSSASGSITFKDGSTTIGTAILGHGSGSMVTSALAAGSHSLTAIYGGNSAYVASTSNTVTQVVNAAAGSSSSAATSSSSSSDTSTGGSGGGGGGRRGRVTGSRDAHSSSSFHSSASSSVSSASSRAADFCDVAANTWYTEAVEALVLAGIVEGERNDSGVLTGMFRPDRSVTVAEIVKVALLLAGRNAEGAPMNLSAQGDWSKSYVATGERMGFTLLRDDRTDVRRPATREEVAVVLVEALEIQNPERLNIPFSDVDMSRPSVRAISALAELGILRGDTDQNGHPAGTLRPNSPVNRAEVAVIAWRIIDGGISKIRPFASSASGSSEWTCDSEAVNDVIPTSAVDEGEPFVVTAYALNVRLRPDIIAPRYTLLSAGDLVSVLGTIADTWALVRLSDGTEGYVGLAGIAPR